MIRLVSQFDNEKARMSLATPTCGCCCSCCCCCCIVSTVVTASISARSFGELVYKTTDSNEKDIKSARKFGYIYPMVVCLMALAIVNILIAPILGVNYDSSIVLPIIYLVLVCIFTSLFNLGFSTKKGTFIRMLVFPLVFVALIVADIYLAITFGLFYLIGGIFIDILFVSWSKASYGTNEPPEDLNTEAKNENTIALTKEKSVMNVNTELPKIKLNEECSHIIEDKPKKKCPKCGTGNGLDAKFCLICRHQFEVESSGEDENT